MLGQVSKGENMISVSNAIGEEELDCVDVEKWRLQDIRVCRYM